MLDDPEGDGKQHKPALREPPPRYSYHMKCQILPIIIAVATCTVLSLSSCSTVEDTGRKQISIIPASKQKELGLSTFQKYKQQKKTILFISLIASSFVTEETK